MIRADLIEQIAAEARVNNDGNQCLFKQEFFDERSSSALTGMLIGGSPAMTEVLRILKERKQRLPAG